MTWKDQVKKYVARVMPHKQIEMTDEEGVVHTVSAGLDEFGREVPDPVPMAIPVGMKATPTLRELVRKMVAEAEFEKAMHSVGAETFEEADDFDIEDDPLDPSTPYEMEFEGLPIFQMRDKDGVLLPPDAVVQKIREKYRANTAVDERGVDPAEGGSGKSDSVGKGQPVAESAAADQGGVRQADQPLPSPARKA